MSQVRNSQRGLATPVRTTASRVSQSARKSASSRLQTARKNTRTPTVVRTERRRNRAYMQNAISRTGKENTDNSSEEASRLRIMLKAKDQKIRKLKDELQVKNAALDTLQNSVDSITHSRDAILPDDDRADLMKRLERYKEALLRCESKLEECGIDPLSLEKISTDKTDIEEGATELMQNLKQNLLDRSVQVQQVGEPLQQLCTLLLS
eukprot:TRINITY_DN5982_c0_g1_i1.p1 TRINITY_DN5982_c0_g1~~TRINITY_DN5982_c0_g1_i1.p1  ORF type:complete len:208 (+),score=26.44 TRINITY_DN5982_c0_g1_i1:390-1013(+)